MSAIEIINELPNLSQEEIRLIRRRLVELAESEDVRLCDEAALQGTMMLDQIEDENQSP